MVGEVEDNTPPLAACNNLRQGRDDQPSVPIPPDSDLKAEQQIVSASTADEVGTLHSNDARPSLIPVCSYRIAYSGVILCQPDDFTSRPHCPFCRGRCAAFEPDGASLRVAQHEHYHCGQWNAPSHHTVILVLKRRDRRNPGEAFLRLPGVLWKAVGVRSIFVIRGFPEDTHLVDKHSP